jgi:WD40 repeat protein
VTLSLDARVLAATFVDGRVQVFDLSEDRIKNRWSAKGHIDWASGAMFAPDGTTVFTTGGGTSPGVPRVAVWWNAADGSKRQEWPLPERCTRGALSPDGRYLALPCHNHKVYILRLQGPGRPR